MFRLKTSQRTVISAAVAAAALLLTVGCTNTPPDQTGSSPDQTGTPTPAATGTAPEAGGLLGGIDDGTTFTPLFVSAVSDPSPVRMTDGRLHLAYELLFTNATARAFQIESITVADGDGNELLVVDEAALPGILNPLAGAPSAGATTVVGSQTWIAWLDVVVDDTAPSVLEHRIAGSLLSLESSPPIPFDQPAGRVAVDPTEAVVLAPPVAGGIWYMSEGCCVDDTHHRRGLAPVNGDVAVPQRYAIDFFLLDEQNRTWIGDPSQLESYLTYQQPILAAADGVVVRAEDAYENTEYAPEPPPIPPIAETVGNHVIVEIADGVYVLYGHMDPGSVRVRVGERVTQGQELGLIGSTGNSTTPHLHFQLLTTPTFYPSDSRPFVFDSFELLGRVPDRLWDDNLGLEPTGTLPFDSVDDAGEHQDELPLDRDVVRFPDR